MKILVAGATGAVGRLLLPLLVQAGHEVAGTTRHAAKSAEIDRLGARPFTADALDRDRVFALLESVRPDVVIHQLTDLATRDFDADSHLRVVGTRNLVDAARSVAVPRMIAQSIAWMYAPKDATRHVTSQGPAREEEPLDFNAPPPRGEAVASVHALESAVSEIPTGIVLRYGLFYGPATWYSRDGLTTTQIQQAEIVATEAITSFVHVEDAAHAACAALDWPAGLYNIVDDTPAIATEWVPEYARLVGAPPPPTEKGAQPWERGASNARARAYGWRPLHPTWRAGFKAALA